MPRYYFDSRDNGKLVEDDNGLTFSDIEFCKKEAARALAEIAREVTPGSEQRELSIDVRDENKRPLFRTVMIFEIQRLT